MSEGWIKAYRCLRDHPRYGDSEWKAVWLELLLIATHKACRVPWRGGILELRPGQLVTGRQALARKLNINEHKIDRILKQMETEQQIEQETSSKSRLITITKWSLYQQSEQQVEQQMSNNRATDEQQLSTYKNGKKGKNEKNEKMEEGSAAEPLAPPSSSNLSEDEWMKSLVYIYGGHVDVAAEHAKYLSYCETKKSKPTRSRFGAWLGRIDGPWKWDEDEE